jgi:hypothetical protein
MTTVCSCWRTAFLERKRKGRGPHRRCCVRRQTDHASPSGFRNWRSTARAQSAVTVGIAPTALSRAISADASAARSTSRYGDRIVSSSIESGPWWRSSPLVVARPASTCGSPKLRRSHQGDSYETDSCGEKHRERKSTLCLSLSPRRASAHWWARRRGSASSDCLAA